MTALQIIGIIIGALASIYGAITLLKPEAVKSALFAFPRSKYPGQILTVINMIWASWLCSKMYLGWFDQFRWIFFIVGVVGIFAVIKFLNELLSPRMLGAFLLLVSAPILQTARFFPTPVDPSEWRIVISAICYAWIILGIYFLCCPWGFRKILEKWTKFDPNLRICGALKLIFGVAMIAISILFYGK